MNNSGAGSPAQISPPNFFNRSLNRIELIGNAIPRIGDSVCNIITPLMSYFPLIVAFAQKYDKNAGIGTIMAMMMPYSLAFFIRWTLFLILWFWIGLPLGPGAAIYYTPAA
jgi:aminobenzoyl-glutamate transport protein